MTIEGLLIYLYIITISPAIVIMSIELSSGKPNKNLKTPLFLSIYLSMVIGVLGIFYKN